MSQYTDLIEQLKREEGYAYPGYSESTSTAGAPASDVELSASVQGEVCVLRAAANTRIHDEADMDPGVSLLKVRAATLFPDAPHLQRGWIKAVLYLRSKGKWIWDPNTPRPNWGGGANEREDRVAA